MQHGSGQVILGMDGMGQNPHDSRNIIQIHNKESDFEIPSTWNTTRQTTMPLFLAQIHRLDDDLFYDTIASDMWSLYNNNTPKSQLSNHCLDATARSAIFIQGSCSCSMKEVDASPSRLASKSTNAFAGIGGHFEEVTVECASQLRLSETLDKHK